MADETRKIIVDDDWKQQARQEKERLTQEVKPRDALPDPSFTELLNLVAFQAMVSLGLVGTPGGERIPPNLEAAKLYVDLLQVLEDKTRGNLTPEEKKLLDQVLYEMRMRYVQMAAAAGATTPRAG